MHRVFQIAKIQLVYLVYYDRILGITESLKGGDGMDSTENGKKREKEKLIVNLKTLSKYLCVKCAML